jgi:protoporphyrinogen oxidase
MQPLGRGHAGRVPASSAERSIGDDRSVGVAVLGAGPAGLTGAYALALRRRHAAVFEADGVVGGLAKTVEFNGYRFDLGGHRFFTKLKPIERLWEHVLGDELLTRPRLSRIYYDGKYFSYPLTSKDVVARLGLVESALCALSYIWGHHKRPQNPETFEEWVTSRFGRRLYETFFRSYTEKVWGIPGSEIRAQWAAQRIKNFSLWKAALAILGVRRDDVTTLIDEFRYPRLGPGQMWDRLAAHLKAKGVPIELNQRCESLRHRNGVVETIVVRSNGDLHEYAVEAVLSSIPLSELVLSLEPAAPKIVLDAARRLRYRDFCLVALMTTQEEPFPDNWIYIHDPGTRAGRVQNFGAWSPDMVTSGTTCLGVEYFCFQGDDIWEMAPEDAVALATDEMARIGLIDPTLVYDGLKVRVPKAYPIYDRYYEEAVAIIRDYLSTGFSNLQVCGRNGLHRYNNQDHSMWTAILAALNLVESTSYDVWSVNTEEVYLEEGEVVDALLGIELVG